MDIITLDFETYYDQDYSLSKLTNEEYIRDPRFEVIGVSVKVNDEPTEWFTGDDYDTFQFLKGFNLEDHAVVAHNAAFDCSILSWIYDIRPKKIADTMSMGRAQMPPTESASLANMAAYYSVGRKGVAVQNMKGLRRKDFSRMQMYEYGEYCKNDTDLCRELFDILIEGMPLWEMDLIDCTIRMNTEPVLELDGKLLRKHLEELKVQRARLVEEAGIDPTQLRSNPQFAELLKRFGINPPMKISPTTGKETYAFAKTDEEFKALQDHPDTRVQAIVAARLGTRSTIAETRTQRFLDISQRGKLPIPLRYYAAHTGRWGGTDKINMQNLPAGPLKEAIRAPKGHVIVHADSSQIEARILAWLTEQSDLVQGFANGDDVYREMGSKIYGKPPEELSVKPERFVGKTTILGCGYGMGHKRFQSQLLAMSDIDLPLDECERIVEIYRRANPRIVSFWRMLNSSVLPAMLNGGEFVFGVNGVLTVDGKDGIVLPNGLRLQYPNLRKRRDEDSGFMEYTYEFRRGRSRMDKRIYGGLLTENICQALARIIIGWQITQIAKRQKVALTVHDSILSVVPEEDGPEALSYMEQCMSRVPEWAEGLPLTCEGGFAASYGELE